MRILAVTSWRHTPEPRIELRADRLHLQLLAARSGTSSPHQHRVERAPDNPKAALGIRDVHRRESPDAA